MKASPAHPLHDALTAVLLPAEMPFKVSAAAPPTHAGTQMSARMSASMRSLMTVFGFMSERA